MLRRRALNKIVSFTNKWFCRRSNQIFPHLPCRPWSVQVVLYCWPCRLGRTSWSGHGYRIHISLGDDKAKWEVNWTTLLQKQKPTHTIFLTYWKQFYVSYWWKAFSQRKMMLQADMQTQHHVSNSELHNLLSHKRNKGLSRGLVILSASFVKCFEISGCDALL